MAFERIAARSGSKALAGFFATGAFLLAGSLGVAHAGCGEVYKPGRHVTTIEADGVVRSAVYYVPSSYTGKDKVAVVFDFHGSNSNPDGQLTRSSWDKVAERNGFIAVALQGSIAGKNPGTFAWNVPGVEVSRSVIPQGGQGGLDEIAFIDDAVDEVKEDFCVDPNRIFASGYSGGGRMLSAYLCAGGDDFVAAGFVNSLRAGRPVESDGKWGPEKANCSPAKPISIMAFAGEKDAQNPYAGGGSAYWQYGFKTAIQRWSDLDGCTGNGRTDTVNGVTYGVFDTCKSGARIATYTFANGTHDWPTPTEKDTVIAAATESSNGVVKVSAVARKPAFDANVDPASRMWDFFGKADSTDVVATAAQPKAQNSARISDAAATDCAVAGDAQGTTCTISQPNELRRSGQGAKGAL